MTTAKQGAQFIVRGTEKLAFSDIYLLHWKELCAIAAKITKDKDLAKDLVQEVFLSFLKKDESKQIDNIQAYLIQALKHQCFNWFRHARIANEHLSRMDKAFFENTTENEVNLAFTNKVVQDIVTAMPHRCREVFELSRFKQLTNEQIASKLNINRRTVENHLTRALKILRVSLKFLIPIFPPLLGI